MIQQQLKIKDRKQKHYHSHIPKGSYHTYCRNRLTQLYDVQGQSGVRDTATRGNTRSFHTYRSQNHHQKSPLEYAQTFQQYLQLFQRPMTTAQHLNKQKKETGQRRKSVSKQNMKKIDNEEIIDSHLPFFKCKLEKTEFLVKRPDFRVKQNKFKVNRNVVQSNLCAFVGSTTPLTDI